MFLVPTKYQDCLHPLVSYNIIYGLTQFQGCQLYLKLCEIHSNIPKKSSKLRIIENDSNFEINIAGEIKWKINCNLLKLDFLSIETIKEFSSNEDTNDTLEGCIQLTITRDDVCIHEARSNIIRCVDTNLKCSAIGFPFQSNKNANIISILFNKKTPYMPEQLRLSNGFEFINSISQNRNTPLQAIDYDLTMFKSKDYDNLTIKCERFIREVPIPSNDYIRMMLPKLKSTSKRKGPKTEHLESRKLKKEPLINNFQIMKQFLNHSGNTKCRVDVPDQINNPMYCNASKNMNAGAPKIRIYFPLCQKSNQKMISVVFDHDISGNGIFDHKFLLRNRRKTISSQQTNDVLGITFDLRKFRRSLSPFINLTCECGEIYKLIATDEILQIFPTLTESRSNKATGNSNMELATEVNTHETMIALQPSLASELSFDMKSQ